MCHLDKASQVKTDIRFVCAVDNELDDAQMETYCVHLLTPLSWQFKRADSSLHDSRSSLNLRDSSLPSFSGTILCDR